MEIEPTKENVTKIDYHRFKNIPCQDVLYTSIHRNIQPRYYTVGVRLDRSFRILCVPTTSSVDVLEICRERRDLLPSCPTGT